MTPILPSYADLLEPTLGAINDLGGSATKDEINQSVVARMSLTEDQLAVSYPPSSQARGSKIIHRLAFARSTLKLCGALANSERSVWSITAMGRDLMSRGDTAVRAADREMRRDLRLRREERAVEAGEIPTATEPEVVPEDADTPIDLGGAADWRDDLLSTLLNLSSDAFERLAGRLLREAGFTQVEVLGRTGDGGIDGAGILELQLLSFPVFFQCKRFDGQVGPSHMRDFRGAMSGRGDKGLFITTGSFTPAAREEARRAGVPPIDLIDGDRLCELLKEYSVGVTTTLVEQVTLEPGYFSQL